MLIVCGIMIGYICSAVTEFVVTFADDSNIVNLHNWSMGSFSGIGMDEAGSDVRSGAGGDGADIPAVEADRRVSARGGVRAQFWREYPVVQAGGDTAVEPGSPPALRRSRGQCPSWGIAVPHVVKRMLGTAKPRVIIPGGVPRRSLLLPAVRPHSADAIRAD